MKKKNKAKPIIMGALAITALIGSVAWGQANYRANQGPMASQLTSNATQSNAYFLQQFQLEDLDQFLNIPTGEDHFTGFMYIGALDCGFCRAFAPQFRTILDDLGMMDDVISFEATRFRDLPGVRPTIGEIGVPGTPSVIYVEEGGIVHLARFTASTGDFDPLIQFLEEHRGR